MGGRAFRRRRSSIRRPAPASDGSPRSRRASRSSSRPPSSPGSSCGWRATASARSSSACCSSTCSNRRCAGSSVAGFVGLYAIVLVYVIGIVLFVEFLALTLTPLVNEVVRFVQDFPKLAAQLDEQLKNLGEFYQRLQIPVALRDWIDGIVAGIGQGGSGSGSGASLSFLLPLITGAGSLLGALFAYFILPVWVAYILKDRVTLDRPVRSCPARDVAVRYVGGDQDRRARFRPVGARPAHPRIRGRHRHLRRAHRAQPVVPDLRALRRPAVGHRRPVRARPDHRTDHLGRAGRAAGGHGQSGRGAGGVASLLRSSSRSRTTSSCRRSRATRSSSTRRRSSSRSSSADPSPGCSGRSWPCR